MLLHQFRSTVVAKYAVSSYTFFLKVNVLI
nr:MAG TPA: hypothetical protein [Caudoviricetes sp.]